MSLHGLATNFASPPLRTIYLRFAHLVSRLAIYGMNRNFDPNGCFAPEAAGRKPNKTMSAFRSEADIARQICHVRKVPDCVEKVLFGR